MREVDNPPDGGRFRRSLSDIYIGDTPSTTFRPKTDIAMVFQNYAL